MIPADAIARLTGRVVAGARALSGGCVGAVYRVDFADGGALVAKLGPGLEPEGWMLRHLGPHLPVPQIIHADDDLLLMEWIEAGGRPAAAQERLAELLAGLHAIPGPTRFGLERDTVIGGLPQPNPWEDRWLDFFRDHRLLFMAAQAGLPPATLRRVETLAARLDQWFDEPERPSLIHGDCWDGNVLCRGSKVVAFIDPATYWADSEIELAFGTLFGTFGPSFFRRYQGLRPIRPGFFEARRDILNLYPLLVHVRLFGGPYLGQVEEILRRFV
ncbi:MAG: fructosamine kinase family protein [Alphaproteobacteria bacterium]|nr:fructosamine kinase family protein [Alphaproteobacteria bacterium]